MSDVISPTTPELIKLFNAALLEQAQEALDALNGALGDAGPFDYNDKAIFDLVERATAEVETVALAVLPLDYVEIIQSPLLHVVDSIGRLMVVPCADIAQLRRVALEFGDDRARRKLFGLYALVAPVLCSRKNDAFKGSEI